MYIGYALVVGVLVVVGCIILYVGKVTSSNLNKDRAGNYDVKVFSGTSSDIVLSQMSKDSFSYVAMIDAGSSGCRVHVYRYGKLNTIEGPLYMLPQHDSKKVKPGLSSFAKKPTEAGASLQGLVDFVKTQVPEAQWENTPIWLKATAGMRLIPEAESTAVLESVREFLGNKKNSPFLFRQSWARIISGNEEGGFGWIAFNYLKKIIGPKKISGVSPYAVVEMGGASSQVSQLAPSQKEADEIPSKYRFSFTIEGLIIQ
jgi:Golgi nucleoside diphosphatase